MLNPDEYAPGRRVRSPEGDDIDVRDKLTGGSGNQFLIATHPDAPAVGFLIDAGAVRDTYEARDPDEVADERTRENDERENPPADNSESAPSENVTDGPDATDSGKTPVTPTPNPQG